MYNKLFSKILDSTIWLEPLPTRIVWITLIASMDEEGYAHYSALANLANRAGVSLAECNAAVECFMSADAESGDPAHDGRRVERVPGGFFILNASKYRDMYNNERAKELNRQRVAAHRAKKKGIITEALQPVTDHVSHEYASEYEKVPKELKSSDFQTAWNALGGAFKKIAKWTEKRQAAWKQRMADAFFAQNWKAAIAKLPMSAFLRGENNNGWIADVDFFLRPDSVAKIIEGKYDGSTQNRGLFEKHKVGYHSEHQEADIAALEKRAVSYRPKKDDGSRPASSDDQWPASVPT